MSTTTPRDDTAAPALAERASLSERAALGLVAFWYLTGAVLVTWWLWHDPASRVVAGNPNDADQMAWFFRYDATAIQHFHLPALVTTGMNAPHGVNVMWNTFMLLPGVALAPVTLLAGPQTSLTVLLTAGFAGSALAMFFVLRRWRIGLAAAVLGGAVFGFSPALLHTAIGHYDLQFAVLLPLLIDAGLGLICARSTPVRDGLYLGLLVAAQLFINEEMLFDTALTGVIITAVLAVRYRHLVSARVRSVAVGLAVAFGVIAVLAGYPLWVQFFGRLQQHGSPFLADFFKTDPAGFVQPSGLMLVHSADSAARAAAYQGGLSEYLAFLGVPLLLVLAAGTAYCWRRPAVPALAAAWLVTELFSLGGTLLLSGHGHASVKLPWYWLQSLPLLESVIPARFSIVADGLAAALLAFAFDAALLRAAGLRAAVSRWWVPVVSGVVALAVVPVVPRPLPAEAVGGVPDGWSAALACLHLPANANVLVVPIPEGAFTAPLRWAADTGVPRSMVGGYFMGPAWDGYVYVDGDG
ncbi:MAG TPA: hypothetical protein VKU39_05845, partial [Streptosporangiaceae bacterium]|nr:hypothetical protein [Streptosporangiaceae bacterium]